MERKWRREEVMGGNKEVRKRGVWGEEHSFLVDGVGGRMEVLERKWRREGGREGGGARDLPSYPLLCGVSSLTSPFSLCFTLIFPSLSLSAPGAN